MEFVSFQASAAGGAPTARTCPRSQTHSPVCPHTPSWAGPSPSPPAWLGLPHHPSCHSALSHLPAPLLTPQLLSARLALHITRASSLQMYNSCDRRTAFVQVAKLIGPYCRSCKKCRVFDKDRAVPEWLPKPPHRSWTFCKPSSQLPQQLCPGEPGRSEAGSQASAPHAQATSVTAVGSQQT